MSEAMSATLWGRLCAGARRAAGVASFIAALAWAGPVDAQSPEYSVTNRATVSYTDDEGTRGTAEDSTTVTVQAGSAGNLVLRKEADRSVAAAGDTIGYVIHWRNTGTGVLNDVTLTDVLPEALTFLAGSVVSDAVVTTDVSAQVLTFDVGTVAPGESGSLYFRAIVSGRSAVISNVASGTFETAGTSETVVSDTAHTEVSQPTYGLRLRKEVDRADGLVGDTLHYTLRWYSTGTGAASAVVITDTLSSLIAFVPASVVSDAALGTRVLDGGIVEFTLPDVMSGDSGTLGFAAVAVAEGSVENHAVAWYDTPDMRLPAHSDTVATLITGLPRNADLRLSKTVDRASAVQGDTLQYVVSWHNRGEGVAADVVLMDSLPTSLQYLEGSASSGALTVQGNTLRVAVADVQPGDSGSIRFAARVAAESGMIHNTARAAYTSAGIEQQAASDTAATLIVQLAGELELHKSVSRDAAVEGDTLVYTISWTNRGAGRVESAVLRDSLPEGLALIANSVVAASSSIIADTRGLHVDIGTVAPGDSGSIRFSAVIDTAAITIMNVAHVSYITGGAEITAESDTAHTHVHAPEMELELSALVDRPLQVGDTLTYLLRLINPSPSVPLRDVVVTDSLADQLEYLWADPAPASIMAAAGMSSAAGPVTGGELTWNIDVIAPNGSVDILLHTLVLSIGNGEIVNSAAARGAGIRQALTAVAATAVVEQRGALSIERSATDLEASSGEAVGYAITVKNSGLVALDDVVVHEQFGRGFELHGNSVEGAAWRRSGQTLRFDVGRLETGASATVRFTATVVGQRGDQVVNRAWAVGSDAAAAVHADTVMVDVRLRGSELEARIALGRVWLDENGDGRQQSGEAPAANAVIWSSHGETVRADSLGRFTFPDLDASRYTMRVDPASVPDGWLNAAPQSVRVDGATTPVVNFALPKGAVVVAQDDSISAGFLMVAGEAVPRPRFAAPHDGAVLGTNRVFLRAEGEPQVPVKLYRDNELIASATAMPDGSVEFVSIELMTGPNVFDAVFDGRGGEQKISLRVHSSGAPDSVVAADTAAFRAGVHHVLTLHVLDEWRVPVANRPLATVAVSGALLLDGDADAFSVGTQVPVGTDGRLLLRVRADSAGDATMRVSFGAEPMSFSVAVLPEVRSLVLLADGQIGAGASTASYGSAVARGSIGSETAVTLSYDSRRSRDDSFAGAYDPFEDARYATLGDASTRTVVGSTTTPLSLRVERARSWLLMGDIDTGAFGAANSPGAYRRALPGVSGRWRDGIVDLTAFGSLVAQQLVQRQIRGDGTSGPYQLGGAIRLGTERLAVETRDRFNASLVLSRQELERFIDYDIDAATGAVLLRRPLASADAAGNPIMLVALAEQIDGERAFVGGVRAELAFTPFTSASDSVRLGGGFVEDRSPLGGHRLMSADIAAQSQLGGGRLELARAEAGDSAGHAWRASGWVGNEDGTRATLEWSRVGDGFGNPANPRLVSGTEDLRLSGRTTVAGWNGTASYARQWFRARGAERTQTSLTVGRSIGSRKISLDLGVLGEQMDGDTLDLSSTSLTSRLTLAETDRSLWLEALHPLREAGTASRPATYGVGVTYDLGLGVKAEASQRILHSDSLTQGVTTIGLRTELSTGTRLWSEYQLSNADAARSSTGLIGIGQQLRLGAWLLDGQYERRAGLSLLPETDPSRALPFAQPERDRWAAALGVSWAPAGATAKATLRGELSDDAQTGRGFRIFGTGEAALNRSLTLFLRQDARETNQLLADRAMRTRTLRSIAAAAFRPAERSDWNALFKLEWRNDENPQRNGGAFLEGTDRRLIAAAEAVWSPGAGTEIGLRYAMRNGERVGLMAGGAAVSSNAHFAGLRLRNQLNRWLDVRGSARMLAELKSQMVRLDVAPALGITLLQGLDLETGYRFGDLADTDLAQSGGNGFYVTLGMSLTEDAGATIADFWRRRIEGTR